MISPELLMRVRRVDDAAHVTAFVAAWLVAELAKTRPVDLVTCSAELIELVVGSDDRDGLLGEIKELLGERRFQGWELCHD